MTATLFSRLEIITAGLVLLALCTPLRAQEEQLIRCPVTEVMSEITTPLPDDWWHAPIMGRLTDSTVRMVAGKPVLACIYEVNGQPVAVIRRPPAEAPNCMARDKGFSFVCSAAEGDAAAPAAATVAVAAGGRCQNLVQDRIEWDYKGSKRWARSNLEKLCLNAEQSDQPGICFDRVMHGNLSHGKGTRWRWRFALRLCAGTLDADATIGCFSSAIAAETPWPEAIDSCRAES